MTDPVITIEQLESDIITAHAERGDAGVISYLQRISFDNSGTLSTQIQLDTETAALVRDTNFNGTRRFDLDQNGYTLPGEVLAVFAAHVIHSEGTPAAQFAAARPIAEALCGCRR